VELAIFAAEFVSEPANLMPVAVVAILECFFLLLASIGRAISSPVAHAIVADAIAGVVVLAAGFFIWSKELHLILPEPLFWVGLGLTLVSAWPILWAFALLLRRLQRRRLVVTGVDEFQ
jgi:hypothetical protein